jgi:hypothetical protein
MLAPLALLTAALTGCQAHTFGLRAVDLDHSYAYLDEQVPRQIDHPALGALKTGGDTLQTGGSWFAPQDDSTTADTTNEYRVLRGTTLVSDNSQSADSADSPYFSPDPQAEPIEPHHGHGFGEHKESMLRRMGERVRGMFTPHRPATSFRTTIQRPFRAVSQRAMELPVVGAKGIPIPIAAPKGFAAKAGKKLGWPAPRSWANPVIVDYPQTPELVRSAGNDDTSVLLSNGRASANGPVMSVPVWNTDATE